MATKSWDPLLSNSEADAEIISAAQKRQIRNILKSYVGMYDPFSELIQNAMDAADRRATELKENGYEQRLWLTIDLQENSFAITDNGIGFKEKEFKSFLAPNISFKDGETSRGNKGVGATYIAYGFDYLQFATKGNDHEFAGEIKSGRTWVEDAKGIVTRPVVVESDFADPAFSAIDRGASFKIKFGGKNTRPKDLSWYGATTAEQWLYLLLIKTPLGGIQFQAGGNSSIRFDLSVIDKAGVKTTASNHAAVYMYPHTKIKASVNLKEVLTLQQKLLNSGKDAAALPAKYYKSNGIHESFSTNDLLELRHWADDNHVEIIKQYKVEAYGYFAYSTSIWNQLNDDLAKLRKGYRVLRGGLQLANNQMIQGDLIVIPLTSDTGYQNQCHIIVHFKGADPDLGRKGFQPELKEAAEAIAVAIVNRLKKWKKLLKSDSGTKPDIAKEVELHEWIKQQERHEEDYPLVIKNKNFFAPLNEISITSVPQSEQDVIVLFNQLVAGGVIRGIKLLATNQIKQYDSVFKFVVKKPLANHVFDKTTNPLGVEELRFSSEHVGAPKILEYKYNLDALMYDFDNGEKNEKEVHLAVVWEIGSEWQKKYDATSLLDFDNIHLRDFHGLTHVLDSGTTKFHVIALKELIDCLNDFDAVQSHHKKTYSKDLF
jgi:hypothetical protein